MKFCDKVKDLTFQEFLLYRKMNLLKRSHPQKSNIPNIAYTVQAVSVN